MVSRKRHKRGRRELLGSHQRCWIWGWHVVVETLKAGRWPVIELLLSDRLDEIGREVILRLAGDSDVPVAFERPDRLSQLCGARDHQGVLARMPPFPYHQFDELVRSEEHTALAVLDRIQDPHNFGAVIRAAETLGMDALIVGTKEQSEVTSLVARSSAGAVNYLPIAQTPDLIEAARELRHRGFSVIAAAADAPRTAAEQDLTGRTVLVLGNESSGVSDELRSTCDAAVRIPQTGRVASLNVAVAAGILFYELRRQRG